MAEGTSNARITVASKMIPAERPIANCLMSGPGPVESELWETELAARVAARALQLP